jgi:hypothetical protein
VESLRSKKGRRKGIETEKTTTETKGEKRGRSRKDNN